MDKLKKFTSPRVLQEVDLELEKDLLLGPSTVMTILATGHLSWVLLVKPVHCNIYIFF